MSQRRPSWPLVRMSMSGSLASLRRGGAMRSSVSTDSFWPSFEALKRVVSPGSNRSEAIDRKQSEAIGRKQSEAIGGNPKQSEAIGCFEALKRVVSHRCGLAAPRPPAPRSEAPPADRGRPEAIRSEQKKQSEAIRSDRKRSDSQSEASRSAKCGRRAIMRHYWKAIGWRSNGTQGDGVAIGGCLGAVGGYSEGARRVLGGHSEPLEEGHHRATRGGPWQAALTVVE